MAEPAIQTDWNQFRAQMPVCKNWAYFDHAAVSPLPAPTAEAVIAWARDQSENGVACWQKCKARVEVLRTMVARLIGAAPEEIALVRSTTEGITFVAEGFPWQEGDNVVTLADEFPANLYPWMNQAYRGVETRRRADRQRPGRSESACRRMRFPDAPDHDQLGWLRERLAQRSCGCRGNRTPSRSAAVC